MISQTVFRLNISQKVGLGHFKRLLILKKKLDIKPLWILSGDKEIIQKLFKNKNFIYFNNYKNEVKYIPTLKQKGFKKVVFDIANSLYVKNNKNLKLIKAYKKNKLKTVSFDIPYQRSVSDISILPYDFKRKKNNNIKNNIFEGSEFFLSENIFQAGRLQKKVNKILISIGGSDYRSIGIQIAKLLQTENLKIRLLIGIKDIKNYKYKNFEIIKFNENIHKHLKWCDTVICGEGLTKFEAISYNKPTIIIHQFDISSNLIKSFLKQNTCLSLGIFSKNKLNEFKMKIINYFNNEKIRSIHMKNQRKIFYKKSIITKQNKLLRLIKKYE